MVGDLRPDVHIIMGDFGEFESVSSHPKSSPKRPDLGEDYAVGNADLDLLESVLQDKTEKHYLEGNHELRVNKFQCNKASELTGGIKTVEEGLDLKRRGWKFHKYGTLLTIGKANFTHGLYLNKYHAEKHVSTFGDTIIYGDSHTFQAYTMTHGNNPHLGMSVGCLRTLSPEWLHGKPNQWLHGMGVVYVLPGGNFYAYFLPIIHGVCVFNGKVYRS